MNSRQSFSKRKSRATSHHNITYSIRGGKRRETSQARWDRGFIIPRSLVSDQGLHLYDNSQLVQQTRAGHPRHITSNSKHPNPKSPNPPNLVTNTEILNCNACLKQSTQRNIGEIEQKLALEPLRALRHADNRHAGRQTRKQRYSSLMAAAATEPSTSL